MSQESKVAVLSTLRFIMPSFPSLTKLVKKSQRLDRISDSLPSSPLIFFQDKSRQVMVKVREDRE